MSLIAMNLEDLIRLADSNELTEAGVIEYCEIESIELTHFVDRFSREVALAYQAGKYSYTYCDGAMNWLWNFMTNPTFISASESGIPEFALDTYLAFDAGEFRHAVDSDAVNPQEKYTQPAIEKLLRASNDS